MAKKALNNVYFTIGGVDISSSIRSITSNVTDQLVEATTMAAAAEQRVVSIEDWSFQITIAADYATGEDVQALWALRRTSNAIVMRTDSGAKGVSNPEWTSSASLMDGFPPVAGSVKQLAEITFTVMANGVALTMATS